MLERGKPNAHTKYLFHLKTTRKCVIMNPMEYNLPPPWHMADKETWYADWEHLKRHALIKEIDGKFSMVVGTLTDLEFSSVGDTLGECIAIANRWIMCVENLTPEQLKKIKLVFY